MQQRQFIELENGRQLGYSEYGDLNGIPVFYFHGTPGSRLEAGRIHEVAVSTQCRLIGIDRPGMGLSSIDKTRSILSWATDVANFADRLKINKFSVIGHSGGAPFVAACAYAIPERLNGVAIVSGMALLDHPESQVATAYGHRMMNKAIKTMPWVASVMMKLTLMMLNKPKMMNKMISQLPAVDRAIFSDPENRNALIKSTIEAFRNGVAGPAYEMNLLTHAWGFDLKNIKHPVTVWHGTLDKQVPLSHAKIYANLIPGAQLKLIENEGHLSLLKNYAEDILKSVRLFIHSSIPIK